MASSSGNNTRPLLTVELVQRQEPTYNARFRRQEQRSTYKITHNWHAYSNLLALSKSIDDMYQKLIDEATQKCLEQ